VKAATIIFVREDKSQFFVKAAAIIWAIWCTHNYIIFEKKINISFIQVIFKGPYWLRL
jgi:hypothetical protein